MRKNFLLLLLFVLILPMGLWAQSEKEVTIKGTANFAKNSEVRVSVFENLISFSEKVVAKTMVDKNGNFEMKFPTKLVQLAEIKIKTSSAEFVVVPGREYSLDIEMDTALFQLLSPESYGGYLQVKNQNVDTNELNYKLNKFSSFFQQLLSFYEYQVFNLRDETYLDTITHYVAAYFPLDYLPTNYYYTYIYYTYGTVDYFYNKTMPLNIYQKYFDNEYVLYDNPAYMALFNQFYDNYLYTSSNISKQLLEDVINDDGNYIDLFNVVGTDPILVNERLRELVIIKNLWQLLGNERYRRAGILKILQQIEETTHFHEHKEIALQMLATYDFSLKGTEVQMPKFLFANQKVLKDKELKGKPTYYYFFNSDCLDCLRSFLILDELAKTYKDDLNVVAVSLDFDAYDFEKFAERYKQFSFPIVHFNECFDWLDQMEITTIPENFILDADKTMLQRYLPPPDQGLSVYFMKIFAKENEIKDDNPLFHR